MTLDEQLDDLGAGPDLVALTRAVAAERSLLTDRRSNYVSIRPYPIGAVAAYVHTDRISTAMEPHVAKTEVPRLPGAQARPATPATTYCIVSAAAAASAPDLVHDWLRAALQWRAQGPQMTLADGPAGAAPAPEPEICPNCWLTLPCFYDD